MGADYKYQKYIDFHWLKDVIAIKPEEKPMALRKMQDYLISIGYTESHKDIKRKRMIEIKGIAENGGERLIVPELKQKYGEELLESHYAFNTIYPIWDEGVVKFNCIKGPYYLHFKVTNQKEKTFDLEIKEYRNFHNTFYYAFRFNMKGLPKQMPFSIPQTEFEDVREMMFDIWEENNLEFSDYEKKMICSSIDSEQSNEWQVANGCNLIAVFRAVNLFWGIYERNAGWEYDLSFPEEESFGDNEYFLIKNWEYKKLGAKTSGELFKLELQQYIDKVIASDKPFEILRNNTIGKILRGITEKKKIEKVYIAVGYAFQSGLKELDGIFDAIYDNKGKCYMVVGALQSYGDNKASHKLNRSTIQHLNILLKEKDVKLYTYEKSFYHGKFYYLCDSEYSFIIMGSSNISNRAFNSNYELDIMYVIKRDSEEERRFIEWFDNLRGQCKNIKELNENNYEDNDWESEFDVYKSEKYRKISLQEIQNRIEKITDEETKFRLNLWMSHSPTMFRENLDIEALKDYTMFFFEKEEIVVFEALRSINNRYYVFSCPNGVDEVLKDISAMSKNEMPFSSFYFFKGNHVQNKMHLVKKIDSFFKRDSV